MTTWRAALQRAAQAWVASCCMAGAPAASAAAVLDSAAQVVVLLEQRVQSKSAALPVERLRSWLLSVPRANAAAQEMAK